METLIGDKSNNVEFFGRCRFIYRIGKDVVDKNCHKMDQAFGFFFEVRERMMRWGWGAHVHG